MAATKTTPSSTRKKAQTGEMSRISKIQDFKKNAGGVMELPSGLVVYARNPGGLQAFIAGGTIPNALMPIVKEALETGKTPSNEDMLQEDGSFDPEMLKAMGEMLDSVAVSCIKDPQVLPTPENEADRLDTELYADEIPTDDKQFLMQWVSGGTRDLETFRKQLDSGMVSVAAKSSAVKSAQRAAGVGPR